MNHRNSSKAHSAGQKSSRAFPYDRVARMWGRNESIATIARAIGRVDKNNPKDPYHSLRNFLYRMHQGYTDCNGRIIRLPYRVSPKRVRACRKAGLRAWR